MYMSHFSILSTCCGVRSPKKYKQLFFFVFHRNPIFVDDTYRVTKLSSCLTAICTSPHLPFSLWYLPSLKRISDLQLHPSPINPLDRNTPQIFHNPIRPGFPQLSQRVGRRKRNDLESRSLTRLDPRRRILQHHDARRVLQTQLRATKQIAARIGLPQLNVFRDDENPRMR